MIKAYIVACMIVNPTMCRQFEFEPVGREITSITDCLMGGVIYDTWQFKLENTQWKSKGGIHCEMVEVSPERVYLQEQAERMR
jgi:hypothetical protein